MFAPEPTLPEAQWRRLFRIDGRQMVCEGAVAPPAREPIALGPGDVEAMLALAKRTEPGPFESRTIEMGRYVGFKDDAGRLLAMGGGAHAPRGLHGSICSAPGPGVRLAEGSCALSRSNPCAAEIPFSAAHRLTERAAVAPPRGRASASGGFALDIVQPIRPRSALSARARISGGAQNATAPTARIPREPSPADASAAASSAPVAAAARFPKRKVAFTRPSSSPPVIRWRRLSVLMPCTCRPRPTAKLPSASMVTLALPPPATERVTPSATKVTPSTAVRPTPRRAASDAANSDPSRSPAPDAE